MTTSKIFKTEDLIKKISGTKKKIGLCHGVFDLLHLGHINHFNEAKKNCDILIVSVTEDKYVSKGPGRPAFNQKQRVEALSNLLSVDFVVLSGHESAIQIINKVKPNFYFKGPDYKYSKDDVTQKIIYEKKAVIKNKGKFFVTKSKKFSSSSLINKQFGIFTKNQEATINNIKKRFTIGQIKQIVNDFKTIVPTVVGEIIIDEYVFCEALGKSGKEPVLVLKDSYTEKYLGGAGAISNHVSQFCDKQNLLSVIGEKKEHLSFIKKNLPRKISYYFLPKFNSTTIVKRRFVDEISKSKVLGLYSLNDELISEKQEDKLKSNYKKLSKKSNLTILSDYGHGMISQKFRKKLIGKSNFISVNVQVNAANIGYHTLKNYHSIDFMIINEIEIRHEMRSKESKIETLMKKLSKNQKIQYLVVTRGASGSILYYKQKDKFYYIDAFSKTAIDKVGAGDAMLSIMSICLYKKVDLNLSLLISSLAASQSVNTIGNKKPISKSLLLKELEHILS